MPKINGHEIDLHKFYNFVIARGGWAKVSKLLQNKLSVYYATGCKRNLFVDKLSERVGGPGSRI